MSNWRRWSEQRRLQEGLGEGGDPVSNFKFSSDEDDYADDYEHIRQELFNAVYDKYPEETMQFLDGIAQRGDQEIASLLMKLQRDAPTQMKEPDHPSEKDEVVPFVADSGYGGGEGE